MSASVLFRPNRKENNSSLNHSNKSLKFKSYRILRPAEPSNLMGFDDREIAEQITHEMVKIDEVIRGYKVEIGMNRVPKRRMKNI